VSDGAPLTRRHVLAALLAGGVMASAGLLALLAGRTNDPLTESLRSILGAAFKSARHIGLIFLASTPSERDSELLRSHFMDSSPAIGQAIATSDGESLRQALIQDISDDFTIHRITLVEGWVVSLTEVRLCALCALAAAKWNLL